QHTDSDASSTYSNDADIDELNAADELDAADEALRDDDHFDHVLWDQVFEGFERNLLDGAIEGQIQYEADMAANREEEVAIPERPEYFFGVDEIGADLGNIQLEAANGMENEDHEPDQDEEEFEDDRRVQAIVAGIEMVREAVEGMDDEVVQDANAQQ
ncbi:hypothetical protein BGZ95_006164, partial [Linnemannia exigua]